MMMMTKLIPTTESEIKSIITSFKPKNSTSFEGISPRILKNCVNAIIKAIIYMCNASFNQGIYRDRFKIAIVKSIYKKEKNRCV